MITTATGVDLRRFLVETSRHAVADSQVVVCSPFIGPELLPLIRNLTERMSRRRGSFRLVTRPATAAMLLAALPELRTHTLVVHPSLHAKVYLGLNEANGQAIVTSANLTIAGLESNIELGVRGSTTSAAGRQLVSQVSRFLRELSFRAHGAAIPIRKE